MPEQAITCECGNVNQAESTDSPEDGYFCICPRCGKYTFVPAATFEAEED